MSRPSPRRETSTSPAGSTRSASTRSAAASRSSGWPSTAGSRPIWSASGRSAGAGSGEAMQIDGEVRRPWGASRELSLRVKGDIALAALAKAAGLDQRIDGKAQVAAEITGPAAAPRIGGRVRIPELGLAAVTARDVAIEGQWVDQKLRLDDIQARLGTGRLRGRLEAALRSGGGAIVSLDLREVVLPGSLAGLGPGTAVAEGRVRDGGIDLARAEATWRGLAASLDGRIAAGPPLAVRGRLTADLREIGRAMSLDALSGRASVSAELTGRGQTPVLEGRAEIADLVAAGHAVEPVETSFRMAASPGPDTRWEGTVESRRVSLGSSRRRERRRLARRRWPADRADRRARPGRGRAGRGRGRVGLGRVGPGPRHARPGRRSVPSPASRPRCAWVARAAPRWTRRSSAESPRRARS